MNALDQLLERVTHEPAYGPQFYERLLESDVYALILAGETPIPGGRVRFVMWMGEDGQNVIPFFSSRSAVRRALKAPWQAFRVNARVLLDSCRGAIVVLNPNERFFCRLTPPEVELLLDTGSPSAPERYSAPEDARIELTAPPASPELLNSLSLLLSQHQGVERAFLVTLRSSIDLAAVPIWLVAAFMDSDETGARVAQHLSALLADMPPSNSFDLLRLRPGDPETVAITEAIVPFYERSFGSRVVMTTITGTQ